MAQHTLRSGGAFYPVSRDKATGHPSSGTSFGTPANYQSHTAADARLTAINAAKYTQAVLDSMTLNDKQYAIRLNDDAADI